MANPKTIFVCSECGATQPKWTGRCPDCGGWNCFTEGAAAGKGAADPGGGAQIQRLGAVAVTETPRFTTGLAEFDRVLGGGLVPGSVVLIGGDPGIGKSTLLLQVLAGLAGQWPVLYVSGEESLPQVRLRAQRLGVDATRLAALTETCVERVLALLRAETPRLVVVDSVQTIYSQALSSAPGSVSQLRETAALLVRYAKTTGTVLVLVGHVTKEGLIAGPRVLEHMVDTVLYFEAAQDSRFRVIRAAKNRFGAVNELAVFAMGDRGLREVSNPSAIFLSRHDRAVPGSVVMVTREGTRPMLVEVQVLVDACHGDHPRRIALGPDSARLAMLLAVLHRHGGVGLGGQDVFVNVVGGMRVTETGIDLAIVLAAWSSFRDQPLPRDTVVFGELGLAGEVRPVPGGEDRLREAAKHGFKRAVVPQANAPKTRNQVTGIEVVAVDRLAVAMDAFNPRD